MPVDRKASPRSRGRAGAAGAAVLAALALTIGACGSSNSSSTGVDPAQLTPASAPVYLGAVVRPSEPLNGAALASARALTGQPDPYARLLALLQTPGSAKLDYARDVRPWLGERAGVFLLPAAGAGAGASGAGIGKLLELLQIEASALAANPGQQSGSSTFPFSSAGVGGAVIVDTSDLARARAFVSSQAARAGARARTYRGVSYSATGGGVALGVVHQLVVLGSESALRGVIDTAMGAAALASAPSYASLAAAAPADALARLYVSDQAARAAAGASGASSASALLTQLDEGRPLSVSLRPTANAIVLDLDTLGSPTPTSRSGLLGALREGATALGELPADSWLGVGLGARAGTFGADVRNLSGVLSLLSSSVSSSSAQISVKGLLDGFLAPLQALGADTPAARRDFQSWMTSAALFASGSGLLDLKAGVEITSDDRARSRAAVGKLAAALRRTGNTVTPVSIAGTDAAVAAHIPTLPIALDIADGSDSSGHRKFVIGVGEASVSAVLAGSATLAGGPTTSAATAALGEGISASATIDFPTLLSLLEGIGLTEDRTIAPVVGYLRALTTLSAGGSRPANNVQRLRISIGLRQPGAEPASP